MKGSLDANSGVPLGASFSFDTSSSQSQILASAAKRYTKLITGGKPIPPTPPSPPTPPAPPPGANPVQYLGFPHTSKSLISLTHSGQPSGQTTGSSLERCQSTDSPPCGLKLWAHRPSVSVGKHCCPLQERRGLPVVDQGQVRPCARPDHRILQIQSLLPSKSACCDVRCSYVTLSLVFGSTFSHILLLSHTLLSVLSLINVFSDSLS